MQSKVTLMHTRCDPKLRALTLVACGEDMPSVPVLQQERGEAAIDSGHAARIEEEAAAVAAHRGGGATPSALVDKDTCPLELHA
jgi:hypothetical protein